METILVRSIFGSHLYGLSTPASDRDYKEVFVPTLETILLHGPNLSQNMTTKTSDKVKNTAQDVDTERFSLGTFIKHLCDGEMIAIDLMHSQPKDWTHRHPAWYPIWSNRKEFYTKSMRAYVGYIRKQVSKYGVKGFRVNALETALSAISAAVAGSDMAQVRLSAIWDSLPCDDQYLFKKVGEGPNYQNQRFYEALGSSYMEGTRVSEVYKSLDTRRKNYGNRALAAANNDGIDWKAVSHAFRACYQLIAIYEKGGFTYPLPESEHILRVKLGKLDYKKDVEPDLEALYDRVLELGEKSTLLLEVPEDFRNKIQLDVYKEIYEGQL